MKKQISRWQEYIIISFVIMMGMFVFYYFTGIFRSGFHLLDDHEFYRIGNAIRENGFGVTLIADLKNDLLIRFRPLYRLLRDIGIYFLGTNWKFWYLVKLLQISAALTLFYVFAREKGVNVFLSLSFGLLMLVGEQSAVWWRLGPQESLGILLVACCFMTTLLLGRKKTIVRKILFISSLVLLSLQKESFLMIVPAFFLLLMVQEIQEGKIDDNKKYVSLFLEFVKAHKFEIVSVLIVLLIEAYIIVSYVGTNSIGYAGYSSEIPLLKYLYGMIGILKGKGFKYLILLVMSFLMIRVEIKKEDCTKCFFVELLFCAYIFGTQLFLHAMSGMWERYFIPWIVSVAYFIVIMGNKILCKNSKIIAPYIGILLLFLAQTNVIQDARDFSEEGNEIRGCAYFIEEHSNNDASILAMIDGEKNMSFLMYMEEEYDYKNGYEWARETEELDAEMVKNADIIWGDNGTVYGMMTNEVGLDLDEYNLYMTPNFEVAIKK
ncbi:MAG: hypothetical protein IKY94_01535 [Lachnospiraceae bacterium]|nr:hypothetical protein [Lachnospiraceae bacterium]